MIGIMDRRAVVHGAAVSTGESDDVAPLEIRQAADGLERSLGSSHDRIGPKLEKSLKVLLLAEQFPDSRCSATGQKAVESSGRQSGSRKLMGLDGTLCCSAPAG